MPKCLKCNESIFEVRNLRCDPKIKKQIIEVVVPCNVCKNCEEPLMDSRQTNFLRKEAADRYREIHGLLTSKEIVAYREKLGMSQVVFARFLSVGEASVKRWETYYVQDHSQDDHIRIKCDPSYSESHAFYLQYKNEPADIYSGFKVFSPSLVKQVLSFFKEILPEAGDLLSKIYFYSDFLHFKRYSKCITGLRYVPSKLGPSPYEYHRLKRFLNDKEFEGCKGALFDDQEKQTVDDVCGLFLRDKGQMLMEFSAKEKGFMETEESQFISYMYAKDLLI